MDGEETELGLDKDGKEVNIVEATMDHGKGRKKEGRRRRIVTKWMPIHPQTHAESKHTTDILKLLLMY